MFRVLRHISPPRLHIRILHKSLAHAVDKIRVISPAPPEAPTFEEPHPVPNALDSQVLTIVRSGPSGDRASLHQLLHQYGTKARTVLDTTLAYESSPAPTRRIDFDADDTGVILLTHVMDLGHEHKVTLCSGFAIQADHDPASSLIVSCAHTLEEMRRSRMTSADINSMSRSATLIFHQQDRSSHVIAEPASEILASLPHSDLVVFAAGLPSLGSLPISPYPVPSGTRIRAHFVSETKPRDSDWRPWIHGTWCKWVKGKVLGYRDFAGREAEPGTYDTLSHLLFDPPPCPGSSGGPIVDEETGSVIGVVLGSRMDSRVEGVRGWGVPAEVIYEMFKLPGLELVDR